MGGIKKFNEFPLASGVNLTPDDILLIMDDPNGSSATKKVPLSTLAVFLSGGMTGPSGVALSTTDDLPEGSINKYFTDVRVSGLLPVKNIIAGNNISIENNNNGAFSVSVSGISGGANTGDVTFNGSTISTANPDQDLTITTDGGGNIYIGADKNMIFDMNAWNAKGILIQDSQEDGYDDTETPSLLKVGSIYHETGRMVIESDGAIFSSGVQVDTNGDPSENPVYGGLWLTNGQDTGLSIPAQTGTVPGAMSPYVEIHNNEKVWYFRDDGTLSLPESGNIHLYNNATLSQGTFDNGTSGNGGISLNCTVGYELNWQGGRLKSTSDGGVSSATIYVDSPTYIIPVVHSVGYSATITVDASVADMFDITLTDNTTLANPTNPVNGKTLRWRILQDSNGNRSVTLGDKFVLPSSATSPLPWSTGANKMDILAATYHAGRDKWDIVAFVPGY